MSMVPLVNSGMRVWALIGRYLIWMSGILSSCFTASAIRVHSSTAKPVGFF